MKCEECVNAGERSRVYGLGGTRGRMGWQPYWDEDGHYHSHDPNVFTEHFECSNNHVFQRSSLAPCPSCEYGKPT